MLSALMAGTQDFEITRISAKLLDAIITNQAFPLPILEILLRKAKWEIEFSEQTLTKILESRSLWPALAEVLLAEPEAQKAVTELLLTAAAMRRIGAIVAVFHVCGTRAKVTEDVFKVAAQNMWCVDAMEAVLQSCWPEPKASEKIMMAAAQNGWQGEAAIKSLLRGRIGQIVITEGVLEVAAQNEGEGANIFKLLLEKRAGEVVITRGVLEAAARNLRSGADIFRMLLNTRTRAEKISVPTARVAFRAAAANRICGEEVRELLLATYGPEIEAEIDDTSINVG